jgi:hypothetical protein
MRGGRRKPGEVKINMIADQVIKCRPGAFVWDMGQIVVEPQFEQFTRKVTGSANSRRRESHLRLGFQSCEELRQS